MREVFLGEYIRQERLKQGITQERLCAGICEPITISRMENGKQMPSYSRVRALLQRLGLPDERFYALLSKHELEVKTLEDEIRADVIRFERASAEDRPRIRAAGLQKLAELEKLTEPDDRLLRQYIIARQVTLGKPDGPYRPEERLELLTDALRLTVPDLDLEELGLGLYSMEETTLLNQIAITYSQMGQPKKAADIYRQLLRYVQKHYSDGMSRYAGKLALIACNYTHELFKAGRYDDALEVAELGRKACVEYAHYQFLPLLLHLMGECYFRQGDADRCKEYYRDAYCLYKVIGDEHDRLLLEKDIADHLGLTFPF